MKRYATLILIMAALLSASCTRPNVPHLTADPTLAAIDSLLWTQPDSAFVQLQSFAGSHEVDSLNNFNGHYFHLLLSELLYKNDYAQINRDELLRAVNYFDSLVAVGGTHVDKDIVFLDARAHYIDGLGYYEKDSVVPACQHYLTAVELMEERFSEKELVGKKAQFMAFAYTRLTVLFSDLYLHEQAIYYGKQALFHYNRHNAKPWQKAWILEEMGMHYEIMGEHDKALSYYQQAIEILDDTTMLIYRDIAAHLSYLNYYIDGNRAASMRELIYLKDRSESEKEFYSRCMYIGSILFHEKEYDSAYVYLKKVFENSNSKGLKKQAAECLLETCEFRGQDTLISEYTSFLAPFAVDEENSSVIKSQLTDLYQKSRELRQNIKIKKHILWTALLATLLLVFILSGIPMFAVLMKKKRQIKKQVEDEQYAHEMKQAALAGRLKKSNVLYRETQQKVKKLEEDAGREEDYPSRVIQRERFQAFMQTLIIHEVLDNITRLNEDKKMQLKSTVEIREYKSFALSEKQKTMLLKTVETFFPQLFSSLRTCYPSIKRYDLLRCSLSLLQLSNMEINVLLQEPYHTGRRHELNLEKRFGCQRGLSDYLLERIGVI